MLVFFFANKLKNVRMLNEVSRNKFKKGEIHGIQKI